MRTRSFPLARMSRLILGVTAFMGLLSALFLTAAALWAPDLVLPGGSILAIALWTWLRMRPTRFVVHPGEVEVIWPLRRRRIPRSEITAVRIVSAEGLRREVGPALRVGVGGLWGGFGWLWTRERGIVQMYVSRDDGLVWLERGSERPWLITPDDPEAFVRALSP